MRALREGGGWGIPRPIVGAAAVLLSVGAGCFAPLKVVDGRSAIERELTSAALRHSLEKLDLSALALRHVARLQLAAPADSDEDLIRARVMERLAVAGIRVGGDPDADGPVLRAVVPFVGVDAESTLLGIPFVVPGVASLGDISLYRSSELTGRARVELSLARGGEIAAIAASEGSRRYRNFTFLTFLGPFRTTDLEEGPPPGEEEGGFWSFGRDAD